MSERTVKLRMEPRKTKGKRPKHFQVQFSSIDDLLEKVRDIENNDLHDWLKCYATLLVDGSCVLTDDECQRLEGDGFFIEFPEPQGEEE